MPGAAGFILPIFHYRHLPSITGHSPGYCWAGYSLYLILSHEKQIASRPARSLFKKPDLMNITERIVSHAIELFIRSGIRAITMDDISAAAGVSKRTIYENFRDKDELLRACLLFMDNIHARETERIFSESTNTIDLVLRFLKHGIEAINSINPLFMTDMKKYHYRIWKETYIINSEKYLSQTFTILKEGDQ
jgi:AcrR family transcriptional regulator